MNAQELAERLDGREYGSEITEAEAKLAKQHRLLVVFGYSDDNVELRGFVNDEVPAYDEKTFSIDSKGLRPTWEDLDGPSESEAREYFERESLLHFTITAKWGGDPVWQITTSLKRSFPFTIYEDGEPFCQGLVIDCSHL